MFNVQFIMFAVKKAMHGSSPMFFGSANTCEKFMAHDDGINGGGTPYDPSS